MDKNVTLNSSDSSYYFDDHVQLNYTTFIEWCDKNPEAFKQSINIYLYLYDYYYVNNPDYQYLFNSCGTYLHHAIIEKDANLVQFLIEAGTNINQSYEYKDAYSPLQIATLCNSPKIVKMLIKAGANVDYNNCPNDDATALHIAISKYTNIKIVKMLIKAGANLNLYVNTYGDNVYYTPLHYASKYGHTDIVKLLIKAGANLNLQYLYDYNDYIFIHNETDYRIEYYYTPLHYASKYGHTDIVKLLIKAGANVNIQHDIYFEYDEYDETPLHVTIDNCDSINHIKNIKLLLNAMMYT